MAIIALADIPQMTSKFAEIVPPLHRRENPHSFAADRLGMSHVGYEAKFLPL